MEFKKNYGAQYIILEENEEVFLTTPDNCKSVKIENKENGLNISGNASLVNRIVGNGMLEKVYVPPVISSENIIEKCDKWLEMYRQVHDIFRRLVLTDKYRKQNIVMKLSFNSFFSISDDNTRGKSIDLDLLHHGNIIQEGVTISVDEENEDVYKYLVANVLSYYIAQNYADTQIDNQGLDWNRILYSNKGETSPMSSNLSCLYESFDLTKIATSLIVAHNLGIPVDQVISNLKKAISNQQISDRIDNGIDYSTRQYKYVSSNLENKKELALKP